MTQSCPVSLVWAKCVIRVPDHKYRSSLTTDSDGLRRRWLKKMMLMMMMMKIVARIVVRHHDKALVWAAHGAQSKDSIMGRLG